MISISPGHWTIGTGGRIMLNGNQGTITYNNDQLKNEVEDMLIRKLTR